MSTGYALTITAYLALVATALLLELIGRREGSTVPTFSEVTAAVAASTVGRVALLALWWWTGWHFLARSSVPPGWPYVQ
jgi:hypothetical protein